MRTRIKQYTIFLGILGTIFLLANPVLSMSQEKYGCAYSICTKKPLESSKDRYCIFHASAEDKEEREFKEALKNYIENIKAKDLDYNFMGFIFKGDIYFEVTLFKNADFREAQFQRRTDFGSAEFQGDTRFWQTEFQKNADFREAQFQGHTDFGSAEFQQGADFRGVDFKEADFSGAKFQRDASFELAEFQGHTDFGSAEFQGDICFHLAEFQGHTDFGSAEFQQGADFRGVDFKEADFSGAKFQRDASFELAEFQGHTYFGSAEFQQGADFEGAVFRGGAHISPKFIKGEVSFVNATLENISLTPLNLDKNARIDFTGARLRNTKITREDIEGHIIQEQEKDLSGVKEIYLLLKNNFHTLGRYDDESWAFKKEKDMERKRYFHAESFPKPRWLLSWLWNLLHGYGEKPGRVVIFAGIIIVFCAFIFMIFGITTPQQVKSVPWRHFLNCLYFSTVTFTTLGYGDFRPRKGRSRLVAGIEAFIGAFMMALFVYTFARRIGGR